MKSALLKTILVAAVAFHWAPLRADDNKPVSYEPVVVTLSGTIVEEAYDDDSPPFLRGRRGWILRLDRKFSLSAIPGDEINIEEKDVTEIHLNVDRTKHPIPKKAFGSTHFTATGTLYHRHNGNHLRPVVMLVSDLKPAQAKARHE